MTSWWNVTSELLCPWCHRRCAITQQRLVKWIHRITYCPFCAHDLGASDDDMLQQGYEVSESKS